jgi:iron(II)-dependent oxidoreductase
MSLLLNREEIYSRIKKINYQIEKNILLSRYQKSQDLFRELLKTIIRINIDVAKSKEFSEIVWQIGHIIYFYVSFIISNLPQEIRLSFIENNPNSKKIIEFYDSFLTPPECRDEKNFILSVTEVINQNAELYSKIISYINKLDNKKLDTVNSYLLMLGLLHQEMHLESLIFHFINQDIKINSIIFYPFSGLKEEIITDIYWISYSKGNFIQGSMPKINQSHLTFDNEKPCFSQQIKDFQISQYPITEFQYLQFILDNGYTTPKNWCHVSWKWKQKNKISLPLYWFFKNGKYYKEINGKVMEVETNLPICHISYYEVKAYCRWKKVRLPLEKEYEFVTTNEGKTKYPWGDDDNLGKYAHLNYTQYLVPVDYFSQGKNKKRVTQLIGNVWEWCEDAIYPYDGFTIDPVYREMSYPCFGEKKICKGGCWAVPDFLIHPRYRNAQLPTCRIQFIGFRVCQL